MTEVGLHKMNKYFVFGGPTNSHKISVYTFRENYGTLLSLVDYGRFLVSRYENITTVTCKDSGDTQKCEGKFIGSIYYVGRLYEWYWYSIDDSKYEVYETNEDVIWPNRMTVPIIDTSNIVVMFMKYYELRKCNGSHSSRFVDDIDLTKLSFGKDLLKQFNSCGIKYMLAYTDIIIAAFDN